MLYSCDFKLCEKKIFQKLQQHSTVKSMFTSKKSAIAGPSDFGSVKYVAVYLYGYNIMYLNIIQ